MANLPDALYVHLKDMLEDLDLQDKPIIKQARNIGVDPEYRITVKAKLSNEGVISLIDIRIKRRTL